MATVPDSPMLAAWILEASGGLMPHLLDGLLDGISATDMLCMAVSDEDSSSSYNNALVGEVNGEPAAVLVAYDATLFGLPETLASFVPPRRIEGMGEFFSLAPPPSLYLQTVLVAEAFRGCGYGSDLLRQAEEMALALDYNALSLHVWEDNLPALALYEKHGFVPAFSISIPAAHAMGHSGGKLCLTRCLL
jgi:ribosomal protein S18 acetylase RimI-like enzyme